MALSLFADRFVVAERERTIDLASGADVTLRFVAPAGDAATHEWLARCAALMAARHPALIPVADFGLDGRHRRFEALACPRSAPAWKGRDGPTARSLLHLAAWLHGRRLSLGAVNLDDLVDHGGQPAMVPGEWLGRPLQDDTAEGDSDGGTTAGQAGEREGLERLVGSWGIGPVAWPRPPVESGGADCMRELLIQLGEVLESGLSGRPRSLELAVPAGVDLLTALHAVARESRLRGYVPIQPGRLPALCTTVPGGQGALTDLLGGRHVLILHDGHLSSRVQATNLLVALGLESHRPHVVLALCADPRRPVAPPLRPARSNIDAAREQPAVYETTCDGAAGGGRRPASARRTGRPGADSGWGTSAGGDPWWRTRLQQARDLALQGRHTSATRTLRDLHGMLVRRADARGTAEALFALGRVMMTRGQTAAAAESFERGRRQFEQAGCRRAAIASAAFVGFCWTDEGRWLEAEAACRASQIAATAIGDTDVARLAGLALARCLLWQGRAREAADALPPEEEPGLPPSDADTGHARAPVPAWWLPVPDPLLARHCLAARIALAADDVKGAGAAAARARERATIVGTPLDSASACCAMAAVYAALGDVSTLRLQVDEGLRAARSGHDPLRGLRLRVVLASGLVRSGKLAEARPLLARLRRLDRRLLPAVVRRPLEQLLSACQGPPTTPGSRPVHIGTPAVPGGIVRSVREDPLPADGAIVSAVVDLLALCESADDEDGLARKAMCLLRERVRAAAAACFGVGAGDVAPLASEGREPLPRDAARRAADAGFAIAPAATPSGLEAAVPVRSAGRVVGALACRWAADLPPDWPSAGAILAASAAVLAPFIRSILDRRALPPPAVPSPAGEIVGSSHAIQRLRQEIERAALAPFNVVVEGESGSGKELVARAIHRLGPRRHHRLCAVNCAALTDELIEAELFGHARGAFTGAVAERRGLFEEADGGTLVLDEVSELTARAQAKLLRVVQEGEVRRVGENFSRAVDVRIVAASNRPLREAANGGLFRRDLLYRLEVIRIQVPALRERPEDIPLLSAQLWSQATARIGTRATLAPATLAALARYDWPGNVRELQNVLAALAVGCGRRGSVGPERLPAAIARQAVAPGTTLEEARRVFEVRFVRAALSRAGGQRTRAARDLGLTRQGLAKLLARLQIDDGCEGVTAPREAGEGGAAAAGPGVRCSSGRA